MNLHKVVAVTKQSKIQQLAQQVASEVFVADDIEDAYDLVRTIRPDLILFDHHTEPAHIQNLLNTTKSISKTPIIVAGKGHTTNNPYSELVQNGICHYLHGQSDYPRLKQIVAELKNKKPKRSKQKFKNFFADDICTSLSFVGRSEATLKTLKMIKLVAASKCNPVLIIGETGTGKELAAKAVHMLRQPDHPFVAVNCAALTANLLESELFGHVKGSFTSADSEKTGLLELAAEGSLFLDEISEMPMDLQAKLLRVLQERTFRKVGGTEEITCKATIIATSNRNLHHEVQAKRFRQDLFYRLNICPITIAPLRSPQRKEDISLLTKYFIKTSTICPDKTNKINSITKLAAEALQKHDWPGNVRELQNTIERAIILETTSKIGLSSIAIGTEQFDTFESTTEDDKMKIFSIDKAERQLIARALRQTNWQKTKAATLLGITRATLYAKLKQHNLDQNINFDPEYEDELQQEAETTHQPTILNSP